MNGSWREVVRLAFKGNRFHNHALDSAALTELIRFQRMIAETAKVLWREANPIRERLPKRFEEKTRLYMRTIAEGSSVVPLELFIEQPSQLEIFDPEPKEVPKAIALAHEVFLAVENDRVLPETFPKSLISEYQQFGEALQDDDVIELKPVDRDPVLVTRLSRERLATFNDANQAGHVDVTGEVLEADVRQKRFQLWLNENYFITILFTDDQEVQVTNALRNHRTLRVRIVGKGEYSPLGRVERVTFVDSLTVRPLELAFDAKARPIEDVLVELAQDIPITEWKKLPPDLTDNLDHYLYGSPKQ